MKFYLFLAFLISCAQPSLIAEKKFAPQKHQTNNSNSFSNVTYIKNYDGDTITFSIPGVHPLIGDNIPVRVRGVDTAELRTKNTCEKEIGKITKNYVRKLLLAAKRIDLLNIERGKYFRIVADVLIDGENLKGKLIDHHLAYEYDGGTKKKVNWCEGKNRIPANLLLE